MNSFTADGNNAFLVTENGGVSTLHKFPIAGGSDTPIMTYNGDADWTVSDGTTVYFADDVASTNGIYSVPVAGGRSSRCWVVRLCSQLSRSSPGTATTPRWERSTQPTAVARVRCSRNGSP